MWIVCVMYCWLSICLTCYRWERQCCTPYTWIPTMKLWIKISLQTVAWWALSSPLLYTTTQPVATVLQPHYLLQCEVYTVCPCMCKLRMCNGKLWEAFLKASEFHSLYINCKDISLKLKKNWCSRCEAELTITFAPPYTDSERISGGVREGAGWFPEEWSVLWGWWPSPLCHVCLRCSVDHGSGPAGHRQATQVSSPPHTTH